jgi:predicted protein tyrosine phosphatase
MFEFKVLGLSEAEVEIARDWPTLIVSAISLNHPLPCQGRHHLIVDVEDVHIATGNSFATAEMLETILTHTVALHDRDRVLVHCFAGQSRSSAVMLAILIQHGLGAVEAFAAVLENRPMMIPNQLIARLIDERFGLGGELIEINNAHVSAALRSPSRVTGVTPTQSAAMKKIMDLFD